MVNGHDETLGELSSKLESLSMEFRGVLQTVDDQVYFIYSGCNSCCNKALFMKQKCQIQKGVGQYEDAATPFRSRSISTTHQHFQMRYKTLIYLKGLKSCQPPNFKCVISVLKQTLHFYFHL